MCGIAGIINLTENDAYQAQNIHRMTNKIRHRGPDDEGFLLIDKTGCQLFLGDDTPSHDAQAQLADNYPTEHIKNAYQLHSNIAFGHRRLSIIDLTFAGHQPMSYLDRYWIVYNGEIYNYVELKTQLQASGYSFHSTTDTEVILAAYDKWNSDCLNMFNGMWALVIYDSQENTLFISRDRFGIKPLYYYHDKKNFIFASEIKALLAHSEVKTAPNLAYCKEYITAGPRDYIRETAFENIFRFEQAGFMETTIDELRSGGVNEQKFWDYQPNLHEETYNEQKARQYARQYYDLLAESVRIRLRADVKIGAALSGGLDSSTISYIINQHLAKEGKTEKQETFSSVYKTPGTQHCDESGYIDELARFLNVNSNQIEPLPEDIAHEHEKMIYAMENPPGGSNMGGWFTFKRVAQSDVIINLDGQGADEQLAGYFKYLWRYFAHLPLSEIPRQYKEFSQVPGVEKTKMLLGIMINLLHKILGKKLLKKILAAAGAQRTLSLLTPVNQALHDDTTSYQLVNLLHLGDGQSMAHSIESRVPFMDYRLVEFLASVPMVYKIHNGWTKYLARLALDKKLPHQITWRKDKMGWPDPADYWFRGPLKEWLCRRVESSAFLKQLNLGNNVRARLDGKEDIIHFTRLLNLSTWHKIFFNGDSLCQNQQTADSIHAEHLAQYD